MCVCILVCACLLSWSLLILKCCNITHQVVKEGGKEEGWRVVYQKDNQPDADTLEIPDLTPFTQYR